MRRRRSERGAALLTVLLLVAVMAVLSAAALEKLKLATHLTANTISAEQARAYARAAETVARYRIGDLIQRDGARTTLVGDWAGRPTAFPIDGGIATARLDDAGNCFNLNSLVDRSAEGLLVARPVAIEQFTRLLTLIEVPPRDALQLAAVTADWIDSDTVPLPGGAEDAGYAGGRTANTLMADESELRAVAGMTAATYARVRPFVCALPVTDLSQINVNTVSRDRALLLAMVLPDLDVRRAQEAIDARPMAGFDSLATFWNLPGLGGAPPSDDARGQVRAASRWFGLSVVIELPDAELESHTLIDAVAKPARVVRRSYGARA